MYLGIIKWQNILAYLGNIGVALYVKEISAECRVIEAFDQRCSVKKVFLRISQKSQKNTCARVSFLTKLQASGLQRY